jgi:hypothetical protein
MGDAVGSIGGMGSTSTANGGEYPMEQQSTGSTASTSASSQKSSSESFGKAIARGIGELAKDKIAQTKENIRENTFGGKVATAIANPGALAQQRGRMRVGKETPDFNTEVAAFRDKKTKMG